MFVLNTFLYNLGIYFTTVCFYQNTQLLLFSNDDIENAQNKQNIVDTIDLY